jgi:hypothetical protein
MTVGFCVEGNEHSGCINAGNVLTRSTQLSVSY